MKTAVYAVVLLSLDSEEAGKTIAEFALLKVYGGGQSSVRERTSAMVEVLGFPCPSMNQNRNIENWYGLGYIATSKSRKPSKLMEQSVGSAGEIEWDGA